MFPSARTLRALLPLLLLTLGLAPASAQRAPQQQPQAAPPAGIALTARAAGVNSETARRKLQLDSLDIRVRARGTIAETIITARFRNPGSEQLEGDFTLAMPAGSVVTGYALDIGDRLVPGVLVDQYQARIAYERLVRGRIDPGLAEVSRDNLFRTRVFPIPAGGTRTIRLSFVSPFSPQIGYTLPLRDTGEIGQLSITLLADDPNGAPQIPGVADARWISLEGTSRYGLERRNAVLDGDLVIFPPATMRPFLVSSHGNGERFFEISDGVPGGVHDNAAPPAMATLLWDRSLSRADDDLEAEIALARRYLEQARPRTAELVLFDSGGIERVRIASPEALVQRLRAVRYRGATSYQVLAGERLQGTCIMFSDGLATIDRRDSFRPGCALFTVASARDADRVWLAAMARKSGGDFIDLNNMQREETLGRLIRRMPRVLDVRTAAGGNIDYRVLDGGENGWRIVGPMPQGGGEIVVRLSGLPNGEGERRYRQGEAGGHSDGPAALWAAEQVALMAASDLRSRDDIVAFSRRYSVASPDVSFIVLENGRDYAQARIAPPAEAPEGWHEQYRAVRDQMAAQEDQARAGRLEQVLSQWREMVAWRDTRFDPAQRRRGGPVDMRRGQSEPVPMSVPEPPMSPPPPTTTNQSPADELVVTGSRIARGRTDGGVTDALAATDSAGEPEGSDRRGPGTIALEPWKPNRPYLQALAAASSADRDRVFAEQQREHGALPAFWLDVADWAWRSGRREDAIAWVLSALDLPTRNNQTLAIVADRLLRYGQTDRAIWLLERLLAAEDDRPQPRRTLALALARRARTAPPAQARADLDRAIALLTEVVMTPWENAYDGIEMIALVEANALIPRYRTLGGSALRLDPRLIALIDVDLRVTIEWQTESSDVDLWVDEPSGERVIYSNPRSAGGGRLSNDMTQGYGPEEYLLRRAVPGNYEIRANVFAADRINPNGAQRVSARIIRDFGRATEREEYVDIELLPDETERQRQVGTVTFGPARR